MKKADDIALGLLCGGASSRMGRDKCLIPLGEKRLIDYNIERYKALNIPLFLVIHPGQDYSLDGVTVYYDLEPERCSLVGVYSALKQSPAEYNILLAGDMPFIPLPLLKTMMKYHPQYDVVVPKTATGYQPLCAIYHKNCLKPISLQLSAGQKTVYQFYPAVRVMELPAEVVSRFGAEEDIFFNINTESDYQKARAKIIQ
ncbi:molybdenum cofactor guanylyltransferase [candidate division CSSED10-310 bacterium]|uniref:Probable molybdenum cofactor guanylyltransferase n=1 Tax=candidate division CSSED10-310 bacterium TaxID=2855610 RepID=A0ABV6YY89_UNCC1